ncbi:MAG: hypothetical protein ACR2JD_07875 [Nocardioides sp.]
MEDTRVGAQDKDDPDEAAHDVFDPLMAGKDHEVAGSSKNAVQVAGSSVTPDAVAAKVTALLTQPGSAG